MKLSAAIMAHPARTAQVAELRMSLDRPVQVSYDQNPPSADPQQRWINGRRAWELHDPEADYHLVLQDDALVCADLLAGLEKALDQFGPKPSAIMSPYTGRGRPDQKAVRASVTTADERGESWLATWSLNWGVAIIAPVRTIGEMLRWCDSRTAWNYDLRIGRFYRDILGWNCWYTNPSLVDHRDLASLIGHGSGGDRVAHRMHTGSALDIDWTAVPAGGLETLLKPDMRRLQKLG